MSEVEEKRDSVVFYRSFYEAIKELPSEQKGVIYDAIFEYSLNFNEVALSGMNATIFTLIKPQLEANNKKYHNGKKAKRKQNGSETEANVNGNVNGNGNVNVNDNVNKYYVPLGFNLLFIEKEFAESFSKWLEYKLEIGDSYKLQRTIETAYKDLKDYSNNNPDFAMHIVNRSISNQWKGLFVEDNPNVFKRFDRQITPTQKQNPNELQ